MSCESLISVLKVYHNCSSYVLFSIQVYDDACRVFSLVEQVDDDDRDDDNRDDDKQDNIQCLLIHTHIYQDKPLYNCPTQYILR